ncbi:MAG: hypothetical protein ACLQGP_30555, partial [Isosphaeraceae bacterium]
MTSDQRNRRYRPCLEGLEVRDLLSALHVVGGAQGHGDSRGPYLNLVEQKAPTRSDTGHDASSRSSSAGTPGWVSQSLLQQLAKTLYAPITTTTPTTVAGVTYPPGTYSVPQMTPSELHRETFWAEFVGHYSVGAPRFSNQSATIHIYSDGRNVTSNQSLNGRAQILLFPPADPTATPTTLDPLAGQNAGLFSLFAANALQSGTVLFANITNLPNVASNDPSTLDNGLPSQLQFLIDPGGVSGGVYSTPAYTVTTSSGPSSQLDGGSGGAIAFNQGGGVIDIKYIPTNHLRAGASQSGTVIVRMQGL